MRTCLLILEITKPQQFYSLVYFLYFLCRKNGNLETYISYVIVMSDYKSSDAGVSFYAFSQFSKYKVLSASVKLWASFIVV